MIRLLSPAVAALAGRPYVLLTLTSVMWASNLLIGHLAAGLVPPLMFCFIRWGCVFLILLPFAWNDLRRNRAEVLRHAPILIVLGLTGMGLNTGMSFTGLQETEALNALLIQSAAPLLIGAWSFALFRDRLRPGQIVGILISLTGVVVIICRGSWLVLETLHPNHGDLLVVGALTVYALYSALLRKAPRLSPVALLCCIAFVGWVALALPFWWEYAGGARMVVSPISVGMVAYVTLLPSLVAFLFYNRGVQLVGANRAGPFFHLVPLFGSVGAILFLGEQLQAYHVAGYGLVLCGIALATWAGRRAKRLGFLSPSLRGEG